MPVEELRPRVLAVDDEEQILVSIDDLLEEDFEVRTAKSGKQGLEELQKDSYAVIVSDQRMPEMTGDEFLYKAQEISGASRILLTGYSDINALQRAVNHGKIFAYLPKPWDPAVLRQTIKDAVKHYELIKDMEHNRDRRLSLDAARAGVWSWNIKTDQVAWDTAMERLHGLEPNSFRGSHDAWMELVHPEDRALFGAAAERSLRLGKEFDAVLRSRRVPADWRYFHLQAVVVRGQDDEPSRLTGLSADITERKRDEELLRCTTEKLRQTTRRQRAYLVEIEKQRQELQRQTALLAASNRELETLAVVAAHELKEPLRTISSHVGLLQESMEERITDEEESHIGAIHCLIRQLSDLIDSMLRYMHLGRAKLDLEPTDLNEVVSETVQQLRGILDEAKGSVTLTDRLPAAVCNRDLIREVFLNLIVNAVKYNDRQEKRVEIGLANPPSAVPSRDVVICIRDNGIGIEPEHAERIFGMFRRLHGPGEFGGGAGVGLAWAKRIVDLHGGKIWYESCPGKGSEFFFSLALARETD